MLVFNYNVRPRSGLEKAGAQDIASATRSSPSAGTMCFRSMRPKFPEHGVRIVACVRQSYEIQ